MSSALIQFQRQSVWKLLGLTFITGTIYWSFWLRRNTSLINRLVPEQTISSWFFPVTIIATVFNLGWAVPELLSHDDAGVLLAGQLIGKVDIILSLIWIFKVRNRFNMLLGDPRGDGTWFSAWWTIPFGVLYLQFHLNHLLAQSYSEALTRTPAKGS